MPGEEGQAEGDESAAPEQQPEEGEEEEKEEEEPIPTEPIDLSALPPIPLHYDVGENGKPIPAHGVESIFLTGTTLELVGLADMGSAKGLMTKRIEKEVILNDIQFRGAISDFHPIKAKVLEAGAEATHLLIRINETNLYGDNNNFELALSPDAAARWEYIDEETRRQERLRRLEARRVEYEKQLPRSKKPHRARPWVGFGSEVDIEEASVRPRRDGIRVTVERKRSDFNRELKLMDKDAQVRWRGGEQTRR